uniref:Uncharacterized protein n=1 Tax=Cacopsylla melanoneura TaxID=428564 RepID=A0A8D9BLA8_9HEMI
MLTRIEAGKWALSFSPLFSSPGLKLVSVSFLSYSFLIFLFSSPWLELVVLNPFFRVSFSFSFSLPGLKLVSTPFLSGLCIIFSTSILSDYFCFFFFCANYECALSINHLSMQMTCLSTSKNHFTTNNPCSH